MLLNTLGPTSPIDTVNCASVVLQFTGAGLGDVAVEVSADATDGSWQRVTVREAGGGTKEIVEVDGIYTFSASARYFRLNVLDLDVNWTVIAQGRSAAVDAGTNVLDLASDDNSNVRLSVRTDLKKDSLGAIVASDAPGVTYGNANVTGQLLIANFDTIGYASVTMQLFGTWTGTVSWFASNDMNAGYVAVAAWSVGGGGAPVTTATANGMWSIPCTGRYLRVIFTTASSGVVQVSLLPRLTPAVHADTSIAVSANTNQVAGTATVTAGVAGLQAIGGNVAAGVAPTANPVPVGAIDPSGLTRRALSDATGRLSVVGQLASVMTALGAAAAPVATYDAKMDKDGIDLNYLLAGILVELRVLTSYIFELPRMLSTVQPSWDSPDVLRADITQSPL
jgi:hypothetical protein